MLVDSSVWVAFLRGEPVAEVGLLVKALERRDAVWIAPPILQEVLQGADSPQRFARWEKVLGELPMLLEKDARSAARNAAHLYARCRWAGITPRSANDCLIAVAAIGAAMPILHRDRDLILIANVESKLTLLPMTP
jgi:predicted nucleic acid-binding protein